MLQRDHFRVPGVLGKAGIFFGTWKAWETLEFNENLKKISWRALKIILNVIFSFLSLRLESCFHYYPVI